MMPLRHCLLPTYNRKEPSTFKLVDQIVGREVFVRRISRDDVVQAVNPGRGVDPTSSNDCHIAATGYGSSHPRQHGVPVHPMETGAGYDEAVPRIVWEVFRALTGPSDVWSVTSIPISSDFDHGRRLIHRVDPLHEGRQGLARSPVPHPMSSTIRGSSCIRPSSTRKTSAEYGG